MAKNYKIDRSAFVYLEPDSSSYGDPHQYAQCITCTEWTGEERKRCLILGAKLEVLGADTCAIYANGKPRVELAGTEVESMTPEAAGFERRAVRCENCYWYGAGLCGLFAELNMKFPDIYDLQTTVKSTGCCNANTPIDAKFKGKWFWEWLNQDVL